MTLSSHVAVFGAAGHTGRFVVAELKRQGLTPVAIVRSKAAQSYEDIRAASVGDPASLDAALAGTSAVINCAGPFIDTAAPLIEAALRARIPYIDVVAEQAVVQSTFEMFGAAAHEAGIPIVPAAAFYGGLADLLASALVAHGQEEIDDIAVAVGLDSWHPTLGTRLTGERNTARKLVRKEGENVVFDPAPPSLWRFPAPMGTSDVTIVPMSEIITLGQHLPARNITSWMNLKPLKDLGDASTPPPQPLDELGRSSQQFVMDVVVTRVDRMWRATASGRDIYYVTAPLVVAAVRQLLNATSPVTGVVSLGAIADARAFLDSLGDDVMNLSYSEPDRHPLERK